MKKFLTLVAMIGLLLGIAQLATAAIMDRASPQLSLSMNDATLTSGTVVALLAGESTMNAITPTVITLTSIVKGEAITTPEFSTAEDDFYALTAQNDRSCITATIASTGYSLNTADAGTVNRQLWNGDDLRS